MPEKSWPLSKPSVAGLFFRVGKYSWFWGWRAPALASPSQTAPPAENSPAPVAAWSNVAEWLRHMHAQADPQAVDSANQER